MKTREVCFCEGPWNDIAPENRPETVLEREHTLGSIVNDVARCDYADPPEDAPSGHSARLGSLRDSYIG